MQEFQPNFEREPLDQRTLGIMSRAFMIRNHPPKNVNIGLSHEENAALDVFLSSAHPDDIEIVKKEAQKMTKYFRYRSKDLSEEERTELQTEISNDNELKEYIEKTLAESLTEEYSQWVYSVSHVKEIDTVPYPIHEMSDDDIRTFFDLIDRYPNEVDKSLSFMTSSISKGPYSNSKMTIKDDDEKFRSEREKLLELRSYLTGKMTAKGRDEFHNALIDDINFRAMFLKIQKALTK